MPELWQWEQETRPAARLMRGTDPLPQGEPSRAGLRAALDSGIAALRQQAKSRPARLAWVAGTVMLLAAAAALEPEGGPLSVHDRLRRLEARLLAREGELSNLRIEAERSRRILAHSTRYGIPGDLAAAIHDIAVAEDIDPALAFALVRVESGFVADAVSEAGAVGLTQIMPGTALSLEPGLTYGDLFDRETNLRLGFRYLRQLLRQYQGDVRLALLAYNRGPTRVDEIRRRGDDPGNGYARAVMGRAGL
jgi:soluble lytic murein transglycosylase-like protein